MKLIVTVPPWIVTVGSVDSSSGGSLWCSSIKTGSVFSLGKCCSMFFFFNTQERFWSISQCRIWWCLAQIQTLLSSVSGPLNLSWQMWWRCKLSVLPQNTHAFSFIEIDVWFIVAWKLGLLRRLFKFLSFLLDAFDILLSFLGVAVFQNPKLNTRTHLNTCSTYKSYPVERTDTFCKNIFVGTIKRFLKNVKDLWAIHHPPPL